MLTVQKPCFVIFCFRVEKRTRRGPFQAQPFSHSVFFLLTLFQLLKEISLPGKHQKKNSKENGRCWGDYNHYHSNDSINLYWLVVSKKRKHKKSSKNQNPRCLKCSDSQETKAALFLLYFTCDSFSGEKN